MKIALLSGTMSTQLHGKIDIERLFEDRALTGSESSFLNIARGLQFLGHKVDVYCDCTIPMPSGAPKLGGARVYFHDEDLQGTYDAAISASEPDLLRRDGLGLRLVQQQLNDFNYCRPGFDGYVDAYVFASRVHAKVVGGRAKLDERKVVHIPNSIDLDMASAILEKTRGQLKPYSAAWCSSPDRGLHWLLQIWPEVKERVKDATLSIFYRFDPWYEGCKSLDNWAGARARFIGECLRRLGRDGENGVFVRGPQPNKVLLRELACTGVLPYTCEPVCFTEGFAVSVMDACAMGCVPIISDVDALGDIYAGIAHVIPGAPSLHLDQWTAAIVRAMTDNAWATEITDKASSFSREFDYHKIACRWEKLIADHLLVQLHSPCAHLGLSPVVPQEPEENIVVDPCAHLELSLSDIMPKMAAQGLTEQRMGVFGSRGKYYHYHFVCSPMLNCPPSWWSLSDETVVRDIWWHINPGDVVVDAGAAYGSYTLTALAMGAREVIAWTPEEHEALIANLHLNNWQRRGRVFSNGLWSRSGWLAIWPHAPRPLFYDRKPEAMPRDATALFPVVSMDDALGPLELDKIDWIKMDVEGCEVEVLRGAKAIVSKYRPKILVENHLFKDAGIKVSFGSLLREICADYKEVGTMPYATVSHTLWSV